MDARSPRKILLYCHSWLPRQTDGVAVRFMAHATELVRKGFEVIVVTPDLLPGSSRGDLIVIEGVKHLFLDTGFTPGYKPTKGEISVMCANSSLRNFRTWLQILRDERPDVVHMAQCTSMVMLSAACVWANVPLIMSIHTDIQAAKATTASQVVADISDLGILLSWLFGCTFLPVSSNAQGILERCGVGGARGLVKWGPMVDTKVFALDKDPAKVGEERRRLTHGQPDRFLITYVGRFSAEKNIHFLIEAMRRAPDNITLALVGDGPLRTEFAQVAAEMAPKVFCEPKFVGREEVAIALAASDAGVSASCMETTGFCALESAACGTPFLAADALGFHEHLTPGTNARLWTPGQTDAFDEALAQLVRDKDAKRWDRAEVSQSVQHACFSNCTDRCLEAYTHLLRRPLLVRMLVMPASLHMYLYTSLGERLFDPSIPACARNLLFLPLAGLMPLLFSSARAVSPLGSRAATGFCVAASPLAVGIAGFTAARALRAHLKPIQ